MEEAQVQVFEFWVLWAEPKGNKPIIGALFKKNLDKSHNTFENFTNC